MDLLLEIDPAVITHFLRIDSSGLGGAPGEMTARTFDNKRYFGMVIADKALNRGRSLGECRHVRAMRQRFLEGMDWGETEYLRLYKRRYKKVAGYSKGFDAFARKKLKGYDKIYKDMQKNGYKQSASIEENVEVALGSSGEFLLIDGRHRLILAQIIGIQRIPVVINLIAESIARKFLENAEDLSSQLQSQSVGHRLNALIVVPGGRNDKGVLVNAFQRRHFPG